MCNYYFQNLLKCSPKNRKSNSTNNNKWGVFIEKIFHIKTLHQKKFFGKKFSLSAGIEPATYGLEIRCSIQLSYEGDVA